MKLRLLVTTVLALVLIPTAAAASQKASIRLDQAQPVPQGSTISFTVTVPTNIAHPRIALYCYDAAGTSLWAQGQWVADGTTFTLPALPNAYTSDEIASCTAVLGYLPNPSTFKELTETTFAVAP